MSLPVKDSAQNIDRIAHIENEAQSIWHITELLSKLGPTDDSDSNIALSTDTLRYVARQISDHMNNIVEHVESLDVEPRPRRGD